MAGWCEYFCGVGHFLNNLEQQLGFASESYTEYAIERLSMCITNVSRIKEVLNQSLETSPNGSDAVCIESYNQMCGELVHILSSLLLIWKEYESNIHCISNGTAYSAPREHTGRRGRPKFVISKEQLLYLKSANFSWTSIAQLIGASRTTVYRRRIECGLMAEPTNRLTDGELTTVLTDLKNELPYIGEVIVLGALRARGYNVTRHQCRVCIRRIDPLAIPLRWQGNLHSRRPYSVPGPNSLWHLGKGPLQLALLSAFWTLKTMEVILTINGIYDS